MYILWSICKLEIKVKLKESHSLNLIKKNNVVYPTKSNSCKLNVSFLKNNNRQVSRLLSMSVLEGLGLGKLLTIRYIDDFCSSSWCGDDWKDLKVVPNFDYIFILLLSKQTLRTAIDSIVEIV